MKKTYLKPQITVVHVFDKPFMELTSINTGQVNADGSTTGYDSGLGDIQEGDGTEGDARGFSLWDIEDEEDDGGF